MMRSMLEGFGPVVDVAVLMAPVGAEELPALEKCAGDFVRAVETVCRHQEYAIPRMRWCANAELRAAYVVMDARLDRKTLARLWPGGKAYVTSYRLSDRHAADEIALWMAARQPDPALWR